MAEYINRERARFEAEHYFKGLDNIQEDLDMLFCMLPGVDMEQVVSCLCPGDLFGGPGPSRRHCPTKDDNCAACWQSEYAEGECEQEVEC